MELLGREKPYKPSIYPPVHWATHEKYGPASKLLVLIERDPGIQANLFPLNYEYNGKRKNQCEKLAKTLFSNIPEINVHLGDPNGLAHYGTSVAMKIRRWIDSFLSVIFKMPQDSHWPDRESIRSLCPSFSRLAPLLWKFLKICRRFTRPDLKIAMKRANLEFCSAIIVYNPQRAAAQIAAQDAILRHLQDPKKGNYDFGITATIPGLNMGRKRRVHSSKQDQEDLAKEGHLGKKQRSHGYFEESNPQISEKIRHSNSKPIFSKSYPCLQTASKDNPDTPTYVIPPRMNQSSVTSAEKERCLQCRYDDLMMIVLRNGQRWPNSNKEVR